MTTPPTVRQSFASFAEIRRAGFPASTGRTERQSFIDRQFKDVPDLETAVKRVVLLVLKSPRFLYRRDDVRAGLTATTSPRGFHFGLWDSLPDQHASRCGRVGPVGHTRPSGAPGRAYGQRPSSPHQARGFLSSVAEDRPSSRHRSRIPSYYPEFNETLVSDLRTSLDLFLDDVIGSRGV